MKTPYVDIYKVLRLNRFIVLSVIIIAFSSSIISLFQISKVHQEMLDKAFAVDANGMVLPLKLTDQKDHLRVEALSHLELFHRYFYDLNTSNYETNLEKALWLGSESVDEVYRQKRADGVFNRLLQYSLVQKVTGIDSKIDLSQAPYIFQSTIHFEINRGSITDRYELVTSGELIRVDRHFPRNPHGLLITNYFENTLKKLEDEPR